MIFIGVGQVGQLSLRNNGLGQNFFKGAGFRVQDFAHLNVKELLCHCKTFAHGFPQLFVPNAHGICSQHAAFLASFSSPVVIFEQLSIIYALPHMFVSSFTLALPFFPTRTLEHMEDEGDIATAFTLARVLSNIPISRGDPTSLVIVDIHALQVSLCLPACHSF